MELIIKYNLINEILILGNFENLLFKATDIGKIIGIEYISAYIKDFDETEKINENTFNGFRKNKITCFTEKGLIKFLVKYNNKKNAKNVKEWIESVILEIKLTKNNFEKNDFEYEIKDEIIIVSKYCHPCKGKKILCSTENCTKKASYNIKGKKIVLYCKSHMTKDMIYINETNFCIYENCITTAICNYPNEKEPIYCAKHKLLGMIDIKSKKCFYKNCEKIPYFNFDNIKTPKYCEEHSEDGMVNVKDKRCEEKNCENLARYNYKNESNLKYCIKHRKIGMFDKKNDYCRHENCETLASYNYEGEKKKLYCSNHYLPYMINIKHRKCMTEHCITIVNNDKYKGYCLYCFMHNFPLEKVSRNYRTKEKAVSDFIENAFPENKFVINRKIYGGVSRVRPDALLENDTHILIVEIDENQHENYDCSCEMNRIGQILEDLKYKTTIFIRFNPDKYYDINDKLIPSPWKANKQGILIIPNEYKNEWQNRLNILKDTIEYWNNNVSDKMIEIVQLFYDQN